MHSGLFSLFVVVSWICVFTAPVLSSQVRPIVTGTAPDTSVTTAPNSNIQYLIIYGSNFGIPYPLTRVHARIGDFKCTVHHISDTEIRCAVSGYGANQEVLVYVNGTSSFPHHDEDSTFVGASAVRYDFPNPATPGLQCVPPFGSADALNPALCNCWSGSASLDTLTNTDCNVHAVCPGRVNGGAVVSDNAPTRPITTFADDKLLITQTAPIVNNRRDTIIQFVVPNLPSEYIPDTPAGTVSASTCAYPGNIWMKRVNELDCLDEYYGELPWSQHELCGFVEKQDAITLSSTYRVFVSNLVTSYTETFKRNGAVHFRKISNAYLMTVSFRRQVVALTTTQVSVYIADPSAPTSISVVVDGDAVYDVVSKRTIIEFTTTMVWPYQINDTELIGMWTQALTNPTVDGIIDAEAVLVTPQPGDLECDQVQDTDCEQAWILTINTKPAGADFQVCDLSGLLDFNTTSLLCRDYTTVAACQGSPFSTFTISVGKTDVCDDSSEEADGSKGLTYTLESFYDAGYTVPQTIFQTGDMIYFKLTVVDPTSTIDSITFADVSVTSNTDLGANDALFAIADSLAPLATAAVWNSAAEFNITQDVRDMLITPSADGVLEFQFRLRRDALDVVATLSTPDQMTKQLTVSATIDIQYHGNSLPVEASKKRSVVATSNKVPTVAHTQISFYDMDEEEKELEPHYNNVDAAATENVGQEFASLFASSASTVAKSVAFVVAFVAAVIIA